jgi:hypothetical protein
VSLEDAFARVVGRRASDEERMRLYRLRDALGLQDNDAFWSIVLALEHYDSFFRAYPDKLAAKTTECIDRACDAFAAAARQEAARAERMLAERVAQTSVEIARKLAEHPMRVHPLTTLLGAVVAFGALCVHAGYALALGATPVWLTDRQTGVRRAVAVVLAVPAGWMVFALLVPAAWYGASVGWGMARDTLADGRERSLGWCLVLLCIAACVASAVMLAQFT